MNFIEAYNILSAELAAYRQLGFEQLLAMVGNDVASTHHADDGVDYSVHAAIRRREGTEEVVIQSSIAPSQWGSPHDRLDESIIVSNVDDSSQD